MYSDHFSQPAQDQEDTLADNTSPSVLLEYRRGGIMAIDPVCKMEVDEEVAPGHTEYDGQDYYFCSLSCEQKFEHNPTEYIDQQAA
jgi:YHS domain-containing protein